MENPQNEACLHPDSIVDLKALEYTGPFEPNLVCPICQCPFVSPVKLRCDHVFCADCFHQATYEDYERSTCPSCRQRIHPSRSYAIQSVPWIVTHMLDDLTVKCPSSSKGCQEKLPRSSVHDHIRKYCPFADVVCPAEDCSASVLRRDFAKGRCLHGEVRCQDCGDALLERDLEHHRTTDCNDVLVSCSDCGLQNTRSDSTTHVKECPEATVPCDAATYGCDFEAKRLQVADHTKTCPLAKLVPFLKVQNDKLEAQQRALDHFKAKTNLLETMVYRITEKLGSKPDLIDTRTTTAIDASTAHHLLSVHELLRRDVDRVSTELSSLDAKASMMCLNEALRAKDDMARTNAAVSAMQTQIYWLTMANQQRAVPVRTPHSKPNYEAQTDASSDTGDLSRIEDEQPVRRLSDSARQGTKL